MAFWVYMLRCSDGSYYLGHTADLLERLAEHNSGQGGPYTSSHLPVTLAYSEKLPSREEAAARESQIKGWSRKKKETLVRGDWTEVSRLAKGRRAARTT